ncbi:hypothetical protein [Tepidicaulis sp.]|uniref:hypothetical protein n=1 Tax=Tepidicaulis sp. TaxID=1920809 RepID=UPI003B5B5FBF
MQPEHFASLPALITSQKPSEAHLCFCPAHVHRQVAKFHESFPGSTAWAVKANPHPVVLRAIIEAGIREFDVASRQEIDLVRAALPAAVLHFNNPVKAPEDIAHALAAGVRSFALDCQEELEKIAALAAGAGVPARNILLNVRFKDAAARGTDNYNFHEKFGATPDEASHLLHRTKGLGFRAGLTFHPGSQNRNPAAYEEMMRLAHAIAGRALGPDMAGLDLLNVGGGFPCHYPGGGEQPLTHYFDSVRRGAALFPCPVSCEPGRALVADSISLLARINLRRSGDNRLYINDGIYGSFMELPFVDFHPPARAYPHHHHPPGHTGANPPRRGLVHRQSRVVHPIRVVQRSPPKCLSCSNPPLPFLVSPCPAWPGRALPARPSHLPAHRPRLAGRKALQARMFRSLPARLRSSHARRV